MVCKIKNKIEKDVWEGERKPLNSKTQKLKRKEEEKKRWFENHHNHCLEVAWPP